MLTEPISKKFVPLDDQLLTKLLFPKDFPQQRLENKDVRKKKIYQWATRREQTASENWHFYK